MYKSLTELFGKRKINHTSKPGTDRIDVVVRVDLHANDRPEQLRHDARQSLRGHRPFQINRAVPCEQTIK